MKKRESVRGLVRTEKGLAVIFRRRIDESGIREYYSLPGGGIENGENQIDALKRELNEELNVEVKVNNLVFKIETDNRIEYFYDCEYLSGTFELNGEEIERNCEENYYEPTFISIEKINDYNILKEVKEYFNNISS